MFGESSFDSVEQWWFDDLDALRAALRSPHFTERVALVSTVGEGHEAEIAGGGRYAVIRPGIAEVAFTVVDRYQGRGIGTALMRHLVAIARRAGLRELVAEVLAGNVAMLKVLRKSGLPQHVEHDAVIVQITLLL